MSKHTATPGPWKTKAAKYPVDGGIDWAISVEINGVQRVIAEVFTRVSLNDWMPAEANARLISAAPDLLAALEEAKRQLEAYEKEITGELYNSLMINAAIAKAKGEA